MFLKSLEIQGFKSFPDKTLLEFGKGITAVVGPNGSGKSNISDAVRWVLGEVSSKALRGSRMEDVIFGGTVARKPQGFAEVSLTVDNTGRELALDSDEVTVTRRYYRSGESDYLLNRNSVRLKDIHELFMDTGLGRDGYSVIGQGRITEIVAAKSDDRREIFEEAAGISKFRFRKEEAERRLAGAEENLLRLKDIETELSERLEPLKEQSAKAKQYLELSGEKKVLEIGLWLGSLDRQREILREQENKLMISHAQYESTDHELADLSAAMERAYFESQQKAAETEDFRAKARELEENAAKKEADAAIFDNDIIHNNENLLRIRAEIEEAVDSGDETENEIGRRNEELDARSEELAQVKQELDTCEKSVLEISRRGEDFSGKMEAAAAELSRLNIRQTELKIEKNGAVSSQSHIRQRLDDIEAELKIRGDRSRDAENLLQSCINRLGECNDKIDGLGNSLQGYELKLATRRQKLQSAEEKIRSVTLERSGKLQRANMLGELEKNLEGFSHSIKTVMREKARNALAGIHGPVSRLISVPKNYATAIETALGGAMQHIVVENEENAKTAIAFLKRADAGRATFLPVSSVKGNELTEKGLDGCEGYQGLASQLVGCDSKYQGIIRSLLGRTVVAEDLDCAVNIARKFSYRFRIVTLDGQQVNAGGSLTGGSMNRNAGLLSRREEMTSLREDAEKLTAQIEALEADKKQIAAETSALDASVSGIRGEMSTAQEEKIRLEGDRKRLGEQLETSNADRTVLETEKKQLSLKTDDLDRQIRLADERLEGLDSSLLEQQQEIEKLGGDRGELEKRRTEQSQKLNDLRLCALTLEKDMETIRQAVEGLLKQQAGRDDRVEELRRSCEELETKNTAAGVSIQTLKLEAERLRKESADYTDRCGECIRQRQEIEKQSVELRNKERSFLEDKEKISKELARLEERKATAQTEYDAIIARLWDEYELTRTEAEKTVSVIPEPAGAQRRLNEIKSKIKQLGSVNVGAIEEYKEVLERYEFMSAQIRDIEESRDELNRLIGEMTSKMREIFSKQFEIINRDFGQTFVELFGGGTASLQLTEPEDVLKSGIEIIVQPPGKIIKSLTALSGGEQTFVAIALYFSILKVNPSPFCVLDEIEAALDDANVARFASYLRKMCDNTQFIVITHRRGTMDEADVLYGVTMQEEGISKLLTLNVSELVQKLGLKD